MDNTTLVRLIAGVCFLVVLVFLVMRRRKKSE
jgi:LPXTG-motif cell wall-anchored protein